MLQKQGFFLLFFYIELRLVIFSWQQNIVISRWKNYKEK
ncbi:hypothetical protein J504_3675 [Acinetobacter baumannii 348935]|nr:hypothetical protein J504_3675 [Acinetobacter baumannii 348935]